MIIHPHDLYEAAKAAGISLPKQANVADELGKHYNEHFPHWYVFCTFQLEQPMSEPDLHWHNAKIVTQIPNHEIQGITFNELETRGWLV